MFFKILLVGCALSILVTPGLVKLAADSVQATYRALVQSSARTDNELRERLFLDAFEEIDEWSKEKLKEATLRQRLKKKKEKTNQKQHLHSNDEELNDVLVSPWQDATDALRDWWESPIFNIGGVLPGVLSGVFKTFRFYLLPSSTSLSSLFSSSSRQRSGSEKNKPPLTVSRVEPRTNIFDVMSVTIPDTSTLSFVVDHITTTTPPASAADRELSLTNFSSESEFWHVYKSAEVEVRLKVVSAEDHTELFPELLSVADNALKRRAAKHSSSTTFAREHGLSEGKNGPQVSFHSQHGARLEKQRRTTKTLSNRDVFTFTLHQDEVLPAVERATRELLNKLREQAATAAVGDQHEQASGKARAVWRRPSSASMVVRVSPDLAFGYKGFWKWRVLPSEEVELDVQLLHVKA